MRFLNLFLLSLVNFLWAAQFPFYKVGSEHMNAFNLNFWTLFLSTLMLLPFLLIERRRRPATPLDRRALIEYLLLGLAGILPPSVLLAWGIARSTASNASIISLTVPVLMVIMAVLMLGERMTLLRWLSLGMAVVGTVVMSKMKAEGGFFNMGVLLGNVVIFFSWWGSAFYNTYSKKLLTRFNELEVLIYSYVVALAACAAFSLLWGGRPFYRVSGYPLQVWLAVLGLGGLSWGIAMVLWMWVLKRCDVSQVSSSIYLLPIFGVILSALTLHERLTMLQVGGGALVFLATYLTSDYEGRRKARQAALRVSSH